jgi:D-glycero-D-manno-heptose 1,7-bisphosphate phosphatase
MTIAVFLDRDGTLNQERGYLRNIEELVLIPGAAQAVRKLNDLGILAILTTNQSGPARGYYGEDHVLALHHRLEKLLFDEAGAKLDAIYYSPYLPLPEGTVPDYTKDSPCRKPGIGMVQSALAAFPSIDLAQSYILGDKATDVEFAYNAGCSGVLLKTGYGEAVLAGTYQSLKQPPHFVCDSIVDAVEMIIERAALTPGTRPGNSA